MMKPVAALLIGLFVVLFGANLVLFTVNEVQQVIVTQFGEPMRTITEPGLYFKLPDPIQKTTYFDKWLLDYDSTPDPIFTKDKKILVLDNYARWRIVDPFHGDEYVSRFPVLGDERLLVLENVRLAQ